MRSFLSELAYKGEVICSRIQGIAYERPAWNGEYRLVRRVARSLKLVIDIGANVGDWTAEVLRATRQRALVIAIEPDSANAEGLRARFGRQQRVRVIEAAVTSLEGEVTFVAGGKPGSGNGYVETSVDSSPGSSLVAARTLQGIVSELGDPEVDLVKCDVEGAELDVLAGCANLFERSRISLMQVEYNATWLRAGRSLKDLFGFAGKYGYELLLATPLGFAKLPTYGVGLEDYRLRNIVLARPDAVELLRPYGPAGRARVEHQRTLTVE